MTEVTLEMFNAALTGIKCQMVLDPKALGALIARRGHATVLRAIDAAASGDQKAIDAVRSYGQATGFLAQLPRVGFRGTTYDQAVNVLRNRGLGSVRHCLGAALKGDAGQRRLLSQWLCEAAGAPSAPAPFEAAASDAVRTGGLHPVGRVEDAGAVPINPTLRPSMPPPPAIGTPRQVVDAPPRGAPATAHAIAQPPPNNVRPMRPAAPGVEAPAPATQAEDVQPREYDQAKAYGGRAALTFCADETQAGGPTVCVEAATGSNRVYNWADKLRFQLTPAELELMTALLGRDLPEAHFSNHNDKWMTVAWQTGQYAGTIKVTMGKGKVAEFQPRTVQIDFSAHAAIYGLFIRRCARALRCREAEVPLRVRTAAKMYREATEARGSGRQAPGRDARQPAGYPNQARAAGAR